MCVSNIAATQHLPEIQLMWYSSFSTSFYMEIESSPQPYLKIFLLFFFLTGDRLVLLKTNTKDLTASIFFGEMLFLANYFDFLH